MVYVNDAAREAIMSGRPAKFPAGSIIVREKLATLDEARPELLAVMVKRARGFNPKAGDWESVFTQVRRELDTLKRQVAEP